MCGGHIKLFYIRYIKSCFYSEEEVEVEYILMDNFSDPYYKN